MKKIILLLLLLPCVASAQFPMVASWQSATVVAWTPYQLGDSLKGFYVALDVKDSIGKANGDTTYILPNRARFNPYSCENAYQLTSATKPVYYDSTYGQLTFDGTDDAIRALGPKLSQPNTVVFIGRIFRPSGSNYFTWDNYTNADGGHALYNGSGNPRLFAGSDGPTSRALRIDSTHTIIGFYNGASSNINVGGIVTTGNPNTNAMVGLTIGGPRIGVNVSFSGNIRMHEMLIVHRALTADEETSIINYANTKYGAGKP